MNMDVEGSAENATAAEPSIDRCYKALQLLRNSHFDADSSSTITILLKLIRNVVAHPHREDRRRLRRANAKLQQEIFTRRGAEDFLLGVGFQAQADDLVLPLDSPYEALLRPAYALLTAEANDLHLEVPPLAEPVEAAPAAPFDPYKALSTSLVPRPKGSGDPARSVTSTRLAELEAKREAIVPAKLEDRELVIIAPGGGTVQQAEEETQDAGRDENAVVMGAIRNQLAKSSRAANSGLTTRAVREVRRLSQKKVYAHTLLRLVFPDRYIVQAKFSPRETIADVIELIQGMVEPLDGDATLVLSDPPRRGLPTTDTLEALRLLPAARLVLC